jgi:hypothetical protein
MRSRWTFVVVNQLVRGLLLFAAREFFERRRAAPQDASVAFDGRSATPNGTRARTAADTAKLVGFVVAVLTFVAWGSAWLASEVWWLVTGRGPGGRLVAIGAVAPRAYNLRDRSRRARAARAVAEPRRRV